VAGTGRFTLVDFSESLTAFAGTQLSFTARTGRLPTKLRLGSEMADSAGDLQVFGVTPIVSRARWLAVPSFSVIQPRTALVRVAVVIVPDALVFPAATCSAEGTCAPLKPTRATVSAFAGAQLTVAVTVELAPPGTEAGASVTPRRVGEQAARAPRVA
jgi:hypothetical protein